MDYLTKLRMTKNARLRGRASSTTATLKTLKEMEKKEVSQKHDQEHQNAVFKQETR